MAASKADVDVDGTVVTVGEDSEGVKVGEAAPTKPVLEIPPTPGRMLLNVQPPLAGTPQDSSRMIKPVVYRKHHSTPINGHDSVDVASLMNSSEDSSLERTAR